MITDHRFPYEWTLKDAHFTKDKGKVFSCFACGGGSTMGYKLAGFDVIGCNEIDPKMAKCYQENHHPVHCFVEPIQTFKERTDLPDELFSLDILDGSPPCSSFSMCRNREEDWGKKKKFREGQAEQVLDTLFFDFIDLAERLKPKIIVAENVSGLIKGEAKSYVNRILQAYDQAGYFVDFQLLDGAVMGVPQNRQRVIFYAIRKELYKGLFLDLFQTRPILDLAFEEQRIPFRCIKQDQDRQEIQPAINSAYDYCMKNKVADFAQFYERTTGKRKYFNTRLIFLDKVCDTIKSDCTHVIEGTSAYINEEEVKRAGSFPLDYNFMTNDVDYLVGMSVPPVMMAQIATRVYEQWLT